MISELELLMILTHIQKVRAKLTREEIRAASLLATMFSGRHVRYDSVEDSIRTLQNKGFLKGDLDRFELTAEGEALVNVLGEKRIGRSRTESLRKMIQPLAKAPSTAAFIQGFGPLVTEMLRAQKSKLVPVGGDLVLCALLVRIDQPGELFETVFTLQESLGVEDANRWLAIRRLEDSLTKEIGRPIHITLEKNRIAVQSPTPVHTLTLEGKELEADSVAQPVPPRQRIAFRQATLSRFLSNQLRSAGYSPVGSMHRVFVHLERREKAPPEARVPAVRLFYQILDADRALVWVEEFTKPWLRALDLIADVEVV